jgi:FixJ family two-component response regulator
VEGLSHKEIGQRLGINEKTVENHISKGSRLLANYMLGGDDAGAEMKRTSLEPHDDTGHGKP